MTTALLHAVTTLPAALDRTDGSAFGMKKAMAIIILVSAGILVIWWFLDKARGRRTPPTAPTYPILDPPRGRTPREGGPSRR